MTITRRSGALTLLAALTAVALVAGLWAAPAQATTSGEYQRDIFSSTNRQRAMHDRPAFRHQACVQRFAERQATRMANQERMFHQDLGRVLRRCKLHKAGENVAYGFDLGVTVVTVGWMHSPGHRANILDRAFRLLGVGARRGDNGVWYAAQVFGGR